MKASEQWLIDAAALTYWHQVSAGPALTWQIHALVRRKSHHRRSDDAKKCALPPLCAGDAGERLRSEITTDQRFPRSTLVWWAWLDLNQRPHPYQAYSRDAFMLEEPDTASSAVGWQ